MDGSEITLQTCPGCGYKRHPVQFLDPIGGAEVLCSVCREMGARYGSGDRVMGRGGERPMGEHTCPECGKTFATAQGRGAHRAKAHGVQGGQSPSVPAVRAAAASLARGTVEIVTNGVTLPDVVDRIRQRIAECETALRVIGELTAQ